MKGLFSNCAGCLLYLLFALALVGFVLVDQYLDQQEAMITGG